MPEPRDWSWHDIVESDVIQVVSAERAANSVRERTWDGAFANVTIVTATGRRLTVPGYRGNPSLAASPEAVDSLLPGTRARLAIRGDGVLAVGPTRLFHHPLDDAILEAHGVDIATSHAWAKEIDHWNADSENPFATETSSLSCMQDKGKRHTGSFQVLDGQIEKGVWGNPFALGPDYAYDDGELHVRGLSHTAAIAVRGRKLSRVVSIPRLDHLPLRIHSVRMEEDHAVMRIVPKKGWKSLI